MVAGMTAYYMTRQVALVWFGKARWEEGSQPVEASSVTATGDAATAQPPPPRPDTASTAKRWATGSSPTSRPGP